MGLDRGQAFAAFAAAVAQRGAAAPGGFAGEKPVLPFPADFRRLILAFHKILIIVSGAKTGAWKNTNKTSRVKTRFGVGRGFGCQGDTPRYGHDEGLNHPD